LKQKLKNRLELAITLAVSNVKIRYKNSILGFVWSLLTPLIFLGIFVTIFSARFDVERYPLYALTGLIFWNYFNTSVSQVLVSAVASAEILKSINVPTLIFPISAMFSALINLMFSLIPFVIIMFFFEFEPSIKTFQFIYVLIFFSAFTLGLGLVLCAYNVYFRDVGMFWTTINPALFYFTPIVWQVDMVAEDSIMRQLVLLNPIHHFLDAFRTAFYDNEWMSLQQVGIITGLGVIMLFIGYRVFNKLEKGFYSHY
jgi:ABC-type polysaccharide/polyol phosphate export permease